MNLKKKLFALFLFVCGTVGCSPFTGLTGFHLRKTFPFIDSKNNLQDSYRNLPYHSSGVAFDSNGEMYFNNFESEGRIGKIRLGKDEKPEVFIDLDEWVSPVGNRSPKAAGLHLDEKNRLLIAESGTGKLLRISSDARKLEVLADSYDGYRFATIKGLAMGKYGDLFVSSPSSGTIYRLRPNEGYIGILNGDLVMVEELCINADGNRLVASEPDAARIVVFDLSEKLTPVNSWTLVDFSPLGFEPKGLTFDDTGLLYVSLANQDHIRVYDLKKGFEIGFLETDEVPESLVFHDKFIYYTCKQGIRRILLSQDR